MTYYKFLTKDHKGTHSEFDYGPYLPKRGKPGKWLPEVTALVRCERGYHACRPEQVSRWISAELYEVEFEREPSGDDEKVWGNRIRLVRRIDKWDERTQRLFAVWCAREALKLVYPDPRSIEACNVAERYANGEATKEELAAARDAARDAALAAALAAARDAAWAAARDAQSQHLLEMVGEA